MTPEEKRAYNREYYQEHREKIQARRKEYYRRETCKILTAHKQALADDPERLSTDFILKLVQGEDA